MPPEFLIQFLQMNYLPIFLSPLIPKMSIFAFPPPFSAQFAAAFYFCAAHFDM